VSNKRFKKENLCLITLPELDLCTLSVTDPFQAERLEILFLKSLYGHYKKPRLKGIYLAFPDSYFVSSERFGNPRK